MLVCYTKWINIACQDERCFALMSVGKQGLNLTRQFFFHLFHRKETLFKCALKPKHNSKIPGHILNIFHSHLKNGQFTVSTSTRVQFPEVLSRRNFLLYTSMRAQGSLKGKDTVLCGIPLPGKVAGIGSAWVFGSKGGYLCYWAVPTSVSPHYWVSQWEFPGVNQNPIPGSASAGNR